MKRILIVKTSSLGDIVHNLPVASDIRRHFPDARIDWVVEEPYAPLAALHSAIRHVIPIALRRWRRQPLDRATWKGIGEFRRLVQTERYDAVIDTQGLVKSALIARAAKGERHGFDAGSAREPFAARFYDVTHHVARASSRRDKLWSEAAWTELGRALAARGLACVLPWGSDEERKRSERIAQELDRAEVPPLEPLDRLAVLLGKAVAVVGVDTGLTHLAAALGRPVAAIYCGTDPNLTGVFGAPRARNLGGPSDNPSPKEALQALEAVGAF